MATITFDRVNKLINVSTNDTEASVQEIYDAIRTYEDEPQNLDLEPMAEGGGKNYLSSAGGVIEYVGITMTLLNDWRVSFGDRGSPSNVISCAITGGNLVATNSFGNNPIYPTLYTQVQVRQATAPSLLLTGGGGGLSTGDLATELSSQLNDQTTTILRALRVPTVG